QSRRPSPEGTEGLMASFVRAATAACAGAPHPALVTTLPPPGRDWTARAEAIAAGVAVSLKSKAGLPGHEWRDLPCLVGSSSHFIGAREADPSAKLGPPVEFAARLARCFGVAGEVIAVNTACTSGL